MKRTIIGALSMILLFTLAACGQSHEKDSEKEKKPKTETTEKKEAKAQKKEPNTAEATSTEQPVANANTSNLQNNNISQNQTTNAQQAPVHQTNGNVSETPNNGKIDLNQMPATDFSTDGMSPQAQQEIRDLTYQKDFQGLSQKEYNDQVSKIINRENGY